MLFFQHWLRSSHIIIDPEAGIMYLYGEAGSGQTGLFDHGANILQIPSF